MSNGAAGAVGNGNSVMTPAGVMRPIAFCWYSVNHMFPSAPRAIPEGNAPTVGTGNEVVAPDGVMRTIAFAAYSVIQKLPSEPTAISRGSPLPSIGANTVTLPSGSAEAAVTAGPISETAMAADAVKNRAGRRRWRKDMTTGSRS